jgi:hypothetical protein
MNNYQQKNELLEVSLASCVVTKVPKVIVPKSLSPLP